MQIFYDGNNVSKLFILVPHRFAWALIISDGLLDSYWFKCHSFSHIWKMGKELNDVDDAWIASGYSLDYFNKYLWDV